MKVVRSGAAGGASLRLTDHFSGIAWMDVLLQQDQGPRAWEALSVTSATFAPGVRTHWHRHEAGQLLLVVSGKGWVGTRDQGWRELGVGDLVWSPPGEDHWHGATDSTSLTHLAVSLGATQWHDESPSPPVTA
jgi:quercetin dioxygenase-like cupin family protein